MKAYKVLTKGLKSPFLLQDFQYEIGKSYVCDDFDPDIGYDFLISCSQGFHATDIEGILYSYNIREMI